MAILVIDNVEDAHDVLQLARHLLDLLARDEVGELVAPGTCHIVRGVSLPTDEDLAEVVGFDDEYACAVPYHRPGCTCRYEAAHTDPRQLLACNPERHHGPVPYLRCPRAGTHATLAECWMCWSDVHRGALSLEAVLEG